MHIVGTILPNPDESSVAESTSYMNKLVKRAEFSTKGEIVYKLDMRQIRSRITLPKITYSITAGVEEQGVFDGDAVPMPLAVLFFLGKLELKLFGVIEHECLCNEMCSLSVRQLAVRVKASVGSVRTSLYQLRKYGLVLESRNVKIKGGRFRKIDWKAVQRLDELTKGHDPGIFVRLRRATRKHDIMNLTEEDVMEAYDNKCLPINHDIEEEEEYD